MVSWMIFWFFVVAFLINIVKPIREACATIFFVMLWCVLMLFYGKELRELGR